MITILVSKFFINMSSYVSVHSSADVHYMLQAIDLAKKGGRSVAPNPMVGAIIVKDGQVIGQGYHQKFGGPHAEVNAIDSVKNKDDLRGSTIYVTLEPCRHHGKTPACWSLIKEVGVSNVICGSHDPFQQQFSIPNSQFPMKFLEGRVSKKCEELNKFFFTWVNEKRPYITVKMAMSDDQIMAGSKGEPIWFIDADQDKEVHLARSEHQAIMVSATTVINDDCQLNVRHIEGVDPLRVIIDSKLRVPLAAKVLKDENHLIVVSEDADPYKIKEYQSEGVNIWVCPNGGHVDLNKTFAYLGAKDIASLLIEPGPTFYQVLKNNGVMDELFIYWSNKRLGSGLRVKL